MDRLCCLGWLIFGTETPDHKVLNIFVSDTEDLCFLARLHKEPLPVLLVNDLVEGLVLPLVLLVGERVHWKDAELLVLKRLEHFESKVIVVDTHNQAHQHWKKES